MTARTAFILIGIAALVAFSAGDGIARTFGLGHLGLSMGKLGSAGSKGSNGIPPATCSGAIDLSTGCILPVALGLVP